MSNYKIYPSLLDSFQRYLDTDAETYFYQDEEGKWHKNYNESTGEMVYSYEEVDRLAKQDLIDAINRVYKPSTAASKGTAFNELVDSFIHKKRSDKIEMRGDKENDTIWCKCEGEEFKFSYHLIEDSAKYFEGSLSQVFTSATITTKYGEVYLYGYIDEIRQNKVYDIKTSSRYAFGDYRKKWQKHVYPYCLIESGECKDIESFEYTVFALKESKSVITAIRYPEVYTYNHDESKQKITEFLERFIEFLEENKELITNEKIFGL